MISVALALFSAVAGPAAQDGGLVLLAHDGEHFSPVAHDLRPGGPPTPVALRALSPLTPRSVVGREGHRFAVALAEGQGDVRVGLRLAAVEHGMEEELLLAAGSGENGHELWRMGRPVLPVAARGIAEAPTGLRGGGERSALPELARLDGRPWAGALWVVPPEDTPEWLVLRFAASPLAAPGEIRLTVGDGENTRSFRGATDVVLRAPREPFALVADAPLDQLFFADGAAVGPAEGRALEAPIARVRALAEAPRRWVPGGIGAPILVAAPAPGPARVLAANESPAAGEWIEWVLPRLPEVADGRALSLLASLDESSSARGLPLAPAPRAGAKLVDVAAEQGIALVHFEGPAEQLDIRPTMGPGIAVGDADGDGWVDLYAPQGGGREGSQVSGNRFFANLAGRFEDQTAEVGGDCRGWAMGALFFDADGDGRLDLYVVNFGPDTLFENALDPAAPRGWRFLDRTAEAGIDAGFWGAAVTAGDFDLDGDLDLYVTGYLLYDEARMPSEGEMTFLREDPQAMLPYSFPGERNVLWINESGPDGLRFRDGTAELGLIDDEGRGMQAIFWDFDGDGWLDLYVANDVSVNQLWRNLGDGTFRQVSFQTGMDDPRGGMGVAIGDFDRDGDEDLFLTNWELEANALYQNHLISHRSQRSRVPTFRDVAVPAGVGQPSVGVTSWGAELIDLDGDGHLDLVVVNGYTSPDYESTGLCVGQPNHLFLNDGRGRFREASAEWSDDLTVHHASRGLLAFDFDQDGDLDLVITQNNGPLQLLENRTGPHRWLGLRLRGRGANTHAIGALVTLEAEDGTRLVRSLLAGSSYLGGNAPELWFALGDLTIERMRVRWPSGRESVHAPPAEGRFHTLEEPGD